jgi:hypothetical protein
MVVRFGGKQDTGCGIGIRIYNALIWWIKIKII